jgi:hypothetical protein
MEAINIIAHPSNDEQANTLKAFMKAMKIKFEVSNHKPYNPEFVAKILQGDEDKKAGKGRTVTMEELNNLWK